MNDPAAPPAPGWTYGADEHGVICGFRFDPDQPPCPISRASDAIELLARPGPGFVWLHMNLSHASAETWLRGLEQLPDSFFEAMQGGSRASRILRDGNTLIAVINDVAFDFAFDATDISTLWLCAGERLVVTARKHPLRSVDRLRMAVKSGTSMPSTTSLLLHLVGDQADELSQIVRRAADRVDDIEDEVLAGNFDRHGAELAGLRRFMVRLQRLLAPEPSTLARTLSSAPAWIRGEDIQELQRAHDEFAQVLRDVASLQERTKLMQDEAAAKVAEANNRSLFTLTAVTVLALPINLVSGMFGMNVGGIPLGDDPRGFWTMVTIIGTLTGTIALLALTLHRRRR